MVATRNAQNNARRVTRFCDGNNKTRYMYMKHFSEFRVQPLFIGQSNFTNHILRKQKNILTFTSGKSV